MNSNVKSALARLVVVSTIIVFAEACFPAIAGGGANDWMIQPWTAGDTPYQQLVSVIDKRITHGESPASLSQEFQAKAESKPIDPKAQFAWAYAEQRVYDAHHGLIIYPVLTALEKADPGNVHLYTRLRFVITREAEPNNDNHDLKLVGYRLLHYNAQDDLVHKNLVYILTSSRSTLPEALRVAQDWVGQQANAAGPHAVLAYVYETMWNWSRGRNRAYVEKAVAEYQEYLRLAPPDDRFRKHAALLVKVLPKQTPW